MDCEGELNDKSLEMPLSDGSGIDLLRSIEAFLEKIVDETHTKGKNLEEPAKRVFGKAKASLGLVILCFSKIYQFSMTNLFWLRNRSVM